MVIFIVWSLLFSTCRTAELDQCGGQLSLQSVGDSVTVVSPNYPNQPYPNNASCLWTVRCDVSSIRMVINHYDVEEYDPDTCPDNVTISLPAPYGPLGCGVLPASSSRFISARVPFEFTVNFTSDSRIRKMGFSFTFIAEGNEVPAKAQCGRVIRLKHLNHPTFELISANWPSTYPTPWSCNWTVINEIASEETAIRLDMDQLKLGPTDTLQLLTDTSIVTIVGRNVSKAEWFHFFTKQKLQVHFSTKAKWTDGQFKLVLYAVQYPGCSRKQLVCPGVGSPKCIDVRKLCDGQKDCPDGIDEALSLCKSVRTCGRQKVKPNMDMDNENLQSAKARSGSWPMVGSVHYGSVHLLDATLLSPMWLITLDMSDVLRHQTSNLTVRLGSKYEYEDEPPWTVVADVEYVIPLNIGQGRKVFMLKLKKEIPVPFNDRVNTACLPYSQSHVFTLKNCVTVATANSKTHLSEMIQFQGVEGSGHDCNNWFDKYSSNYVCYEYGKPEHSYTSLEFGAFGGSPLLCRMDGKDSWKLVGMHAMQGLKKTNAALLLDVVQQESFIYQSMLNGEVLAMKKESVI